MNHQPSQDPKAPLVPGVNAIVSVVIAVRVVAGRRSVGLRTRPVVRSVKPSGAASVGSYTVHPSLSRRLAGRWGRAGARAAAGVCWPGYAGGVR